MTDPREEQGAEGDKSKGEDVTDPEVFAHLTEENPLFSLEDERPKRRQRSLKLFQSFPSAIGNINTPGLGHWED